MRTDCPACKCVVKLEEEGIAFDDRWWHEGCAMRRLRYLLRKSEEKTAKTEGWWKEQQQATRAANGTIKALRDKIEAIEPKADLWGGLLFQIGIELCGGQGAVVEVDKFKGLPERVKNTVQDLVKLERSSDDARDRLFAILDSNLGDMTPPLAPLVERIVAEIVRLRAGKIEAEEAAKKAHAEALEARERVEQLSAEITLMRTEREGKT